MITRHKFSCITLVLFFTAACTTGGNSWLSHSGTTLAKDPVLWAQYKKAINEKAYVMSNNGVEAASWGEASPQNAFKNAITRCIDAGGDECFVVYTNSTLYRGPYDLDAQIRAQKKSIQQAPWLIYQSGKQNKAYAISENGKRGVGVENSSLEGAVGEALKKCRWAGGIHCRVTHINGDPLAQSKWIYNEASIDSSIK